MSSKSRRKLGKQSFHGKKRKGKLTPALKTAEEATTSLSATPASPQTVTTPPVSKPAPPPATTPAVASHPYVSSELKRIGIIAAIMIAVLVILSRVLP